MQSLEKKNKNKISIIKCPQLFISFHIKWDKINSGA